MSQGKAFDKSEVLESLRKYYELNYSTKKACEMAGIENSTVYRWLKEDPSLAAKVNAWKGLVNTKARQNWKKKIEEGDYNASKDWLERREKDDFSLRRENTGRDGDPIEIELSRKEEIELALDEVLDDKTE